ncbi:MAG: serine/threonine protein kinase, partial [Actinomycetia bacterium]|nr:serine/threonine protein kinase [Actinomycetes bacterium]
MAETFGHYRLDALIGRGGAGEVWRAHDTTKDRIVALKVLPAWLADDDEFRARFQRESDLVARLHEPHIIPIHDYGEIDGRPYLDMRLVDGIDLAQLIKRDGRIEPAVAVELVSQIADALDAAHAAGIVHRDVKPSNVLLAGADLSSGRTFAYLADFGIAAAASADRSQAVTATGAFVGSLAYAAPERLNGEPVDHRADVYSLACLFFEALTGQQPFSSGDMIAAVQAHLQTPPPRPAEVRRDLHPSFDTVIAVGMAKAPGDRYQSAGALATAARAALAGERLDLDQEPRQQTAPTPPRPPPHVGGLGPPPGSSQRWGEETVVVSRAAVAEAVAVPRLPRPR